MAQRNRAIQALTTRISELSLEVRHIRMLVYLAMSLAIILCILVILSLTYADSYNPLNLFSTADRSFSYAGNPLSVSMQSVSANYLYADMIENGTVSVSGRSLISVNPVDSVVMVPTVGDRWTTSGPLSIVGESGTASLLVGLPAGVSQSYNNTHLYFSDANISFDNRGKNYNLRLSSGPGSVKSYDNEFVAIDGGIPLYSFLNFVRLSGGNFTVTDGNRSYPFEGDIIYPGTIGLVTPDYMSTFIPVNETQNPVYVDEMVVTGTTGSLVVGGKEYGCYGADNIVITSGNERILQMIRLGQVRAIGKVDSLLFRGQEYASQPIKNFMRDGYFTVVTGALTAILALFGRKFLSEIRKR